MIKGFKPGLLFLIVLFLKETIPLSAQSFDIPQKKFVIGAGLQENVYAGFQFPIGNRLYFETAAGLNPVTLRSSKDAMIYGALGRSLVSFEKGRKVEPFIHLKTMVWYFEDSYNRFFVLGIIPEFRLSWSIKRRLNIAATGGVMYNLVLKEVRKTAGFPVDPKTLEPSASVQFSYRLIN